ncbi:hypothetical protein BY458DRAFT_504710 [Sporodiniella umbellata]|nr:hypothetical protein BY458DRAFT_504710 [Sporodiniella umbellata]
MHFKRKHTSMAIRPYSLGNQIEELGSGLTQPPPYGSISTSYQRTLAWVSRHSIDSLSPLSPPPLSPTTPSKHRPFSIASSADDDDEPLYSLYASFNMSLLSDDEEEGDDELIPIACLKKNTPLLSAAEKYKAKVKARLQLT